MSLRSVQNLARLALASILVTSFLGQADAGTALSIASGDAGGSEILLARDMAGLVPAKADFGVAAAQGDCGLRNIERLLETPDTSLAFVATDALYAARDEEPLRAGRLRLVASFGPQEIHIVARPDIASLSDLAGKAVNLGPEGSGSAITGARLFTALDIADQTGSARWRGFHRRLAARQHCRELGVGCKAGTAAGQARFQHRTASGSDQFRRAARSLLSPGFAGSR